MCSLWVKCKKKFVGRSFTTRMQKPSKGHGEHAQWRQVTECERKALNKKRDAMQTISDI